MLSNYYRFNSIFNCLSENIIFDNGARRTGERTDGPTLVVEQLALLKIRVGPDTFLSGYRISGIRNQPDIRPNPTKNIPEMDVVYNTWTPF